MTPRRRQGSGSGGGAPGSALAVGGHAGAEASAKTMAGWRRPSSISLPRGASTGDREDDAASPAPPRHTQRGEREPDCIQTSLKSNITSS